jgi:hypothetical protein
VRHSKADEVCVLLVDSEEAPDSDPFPTAQQRISHLQTRDRWDLRGVDPQTVHLMVQCVEAWIVADPEALALHYQRGFRVNRLPARMNLEEEPKTGTYAKLATATAGTQKGAYAKISHASKLLGLVDPAKVAARRRHFRLFTNWLDQQITR